MEPIAAPPEAVAGRPDCTLVRMGPPRGVPAAEVGTAEMLISDISEEISGYPARRQYAYYRPSPAELEKLLEGGFIEVCQYGLGVQPFSAGIWASDALRAQIEKLTNAAMRNRWHLGTDGVTVPVADLITALEEQRDTTARESR